jgi:hypothetical protein
MRDAHETSMKTHVEFRSDDFPPYEDEDELVNPGVYGKRLAEFLVAGLKEHPGIREKRWRDSFVQILSQTITRQELIAENRSWYEFRVL